MSKRVPKYDPDAPSAAMAAGFLRTIAQKVGQPVADPVQRARDLQMIADCVEGLTKWRKPSDFTWEQERLISIGVHLVKNRPAGMTVATSIQGQANYLADKWGMRSPRERRKIANRIATVRRAHENKGG